MSGYVGILLTCKPYANDADTSVQLGCVVFQVSLPDASATLEWKLADAVLRGRLRILEHLEERELAHRISDGTSFVHPLALVTL